MKGNRLISILLAVIVVISIITIVPFDASAASGIANNGLGGIYIDINAAPYTDGRWYEYGNPYGINGCTWFVGARVMELTGKGNYYTQNPSSWYYSYGPSLGFSTGTTPQAPAVICYDGHVAILEKIDGNTAYVSEGGVNQYKHDGSYDNYASGNGYTAIHRISVAEIPTSGGHRSDFIGYLYLGSSLPFTPVDIGSDFYAYIINTAFWKKLVNDGNHNACFSDTPDVVKTIWHFIRNSNGSYKIISAYDGQALDCDLGNSANRTNIGVWDASNVNFQEWFVYGESGSYYLRPNCSEGVLDMAGGSFYEGVNAQIFEKNDSDAQKYQIWKINREDVPIKLKNDFYARIINTHEWKALANDGNHHALFNDTLPENQKIWHFIRKENGSYKIQSVYDGNVLDVDLAQSASGTDVGVWDDADAINQEWYIYGESSKYYFSPRCSDCVLDLSGGNYYDNVNAQIYTRFFTNGQLFQIWELEKPELIAPNITVKSVSQGFNNTEFSWNGCEGATGYDLQIYDISGEKELYIFKNIQATSYLTTLPTGNYIAKVTALNDLFCFSSSGQGYLFSVEATRCLGDADGNGKVTAVDATRIMLDIARLDAGVDHDTLMNGDVNGNGRLDITDVTYIQRYLAKFDVPYAIGEKK